MPIPFDQAEYIFNLEKTLLGPFGWNPLHANAKSTDYGRSVECRIQIAGGVPRGAFFRIISLPGSIERPRLTFQLECERPSGKARATLYRFELNPLRPHTNKPYGPDDVNGVYIDAGVPHEHDFHDSLNDDGSLRDRCDEQGRIVADPPEDFATALAYVCRRINILNGTDIQSPGDQGELL